MSYASKHALISAIVWTLILGGLVATVLGSGVGMFTAPEQSVYRGLAAAIILPGFVLNAWLGWRAKRGRQTGEMDERDASNERIASQATLMVATPLIYLAALGLYEAHHADGSVPTGWLFLLAYGTVALVSLVHAVATLVVDRSGVADG